MEIIIDGSVEIENLTESEFHDKFIEWVGSNGWYFSGVTYKDDEE